MSTPSGPNAVSPSTSTAITSGTPQTEKAPSTATLISAAKLAIQKDMPIHLDYFVDSAEDKAFLGEDAVSKDKMLVKNSEEYTSHIQKIYKAGEDFIIMTENSIYIVSGSIQKRKIQASNLKDV